MKWTVAILALAAAAPAAAELGTASPNFFDTYEECARELAYYKTVDPYIGDIWCVNHGSMWMIIYDYRYSRRDRFGGGKRD